MNSSHFYLNSFVYPRLLFHSCIYVYSTGMYLYFRIIQMDYNVFKIPYVYKVTTVRKTHEQYIIGCDVI